jgi:hypothetical protein
MGTGIFEFSGMGTGDGRMYCGVCWDGDRRREQVFLSLLGWRHEMGKGIFEFIGMKTRDGRMYFGVCWDGDRRREQVFFCLLRWRHEMA